MAAEYQSMVDICCSSLMGQIRTFNEDQLKLLLENEERLDIMIKQMPQFNNLTTDKETRLLMSKSMAEQNMAMEPRFTQLNMTLSQRLEEVKGLVSDVKQIESELEGSGEDTSLDTVTALLQAATQEAEDESEKFTEQLFDGDVDIDEFIKKYEKKRVLYHTRKIKAEKLTESLQQASYNPQLANNYSMRPLSQPIVPHPSTGYMTSGNFIYPDAYRHSGFL